MSNYSLLLFTEELTQARVELEALGARITHEFGDHSFVASVDSGFDPSVLTKATAVRPGSLDSAQSLLVDAWIERGSEVERAMALGATEEATMALDATEGISWDTPGFDPPTALHDTDLDETEPGMAHHLVDEFGEEISLSTGTPTSRYLIGSVAVGVVIVDGTADGLQMTAADRQKIVLEVQEGLDFLANDEPRANVSFVYDIHTVSVGVPPGSASTYESAEAPWRNAALREMGFSPTRHGSRHYVEQLRRAKGTDWAFVAYFTTYPLRHFAYAVAEKLTMHIDNDGWGRDNLNKVFAHETCHIFGAADEYGRCSCGGAHGHLGVPNHNCKNCAGTQEPCLMDANVLTLCQWSRKQIGWVESLFPARTSLSGLYTLTQKSSGRYLDAHQSATRDFSAMTRTAQENSTQQWILHPEGQLVTIQQKSNGRFVDAHTSQLNDFRLVTRTAQSDNSQMWVIIPVADRIGQYTIQHLSNGRFVDAYEHSSADFAVVTRDLQGNDTQRWQFDKVGDDLFTIRHVTNGRFLDAHQTASRDHSVVTRTAEANSTQQWLVKPVGQVGTIQQKSNGRNLDAHQGPQNDYSAVTRVAQYNDTQLWVFRPVGQDGFTIQQLSSRRYLDAHQSSGEDFSVVTRTSRLNDTQRWAIQKVSPSNSEVIDASRRRVRVE